MNVEIPDTSGSGGPRDDSGPGRRAVLTAVGLFVVGVVAVGSLSRQPGEVATTTIGEAAPVSTLPELNDPLDWQAGDVGTYWPLGVVEYEGSLYFFATAGVPSPLEQGTGLDAWLLVDGVTWKPLGTVIAPPNQVHTVAATPRGLVAGGTADGNTLRLWSSTDAVEWQASDLPGTPSGSDYFRSWAQAIGGTDDVTVVFASAQPDLQALLRDVLPEDLRDEDGGTPDNVSWDGTPWVITVHGPLGLTVFSATADDLGLREEEVQALLGSGPGTTTAWTSTDGVAWASAEVGIGYVTNLVDVGGELLVTGYGAGIETWISPDGFDWERTVPGHVVNHLTPWRDGFVGIRQETTSPDIAYSEDRATWEPLGLYVYLPDGFSWGYQALAVGNGGLATAIAGYEEGEDFIEDLGPVVIERDGYTLTLDGSGSIVLRSGEDVVLRLSTYSNHLVEEVTVDFRARTVTFLHPDSLEPLVTFTFDEMDQAEVDAFGGQYSVDQQQLVAFTADGSTWSVENVSPTFGENAFVNLLYVTDQQVIAVVSQFPDRFARVPAAPNVVIWTAVIP